MRVARKAVWRQLQQPSCAERARPAWRAASGHLAGTDLGEGKEPEVRLALYCPFFRTACTPAWRAPDALAGAVGRFKLLSRNPSCPGGVRTHSDAVSHLHAVSHGLPEPWSGIPALSTAMLLSSVRAAGALPAPERSQLWSLGHPGLAAGSWVNAHVLGGLTAACRGAAHPLGRAERCSLCTLEKALGLCETGLPGACPVAPIARAAVCARAGALRT